MKRQKCVLAVFLALAACAPLAFAAAQGGLPSADAVKFLGAWNLGLETPQGAMTMVLTVKGPAGGTVSGEITSDRAPAPQAITDVSKAGESLVLKYVMDIQGMTIPAKITLTPAGEKMTVNFDFADGQFTMDGTAAKKP
jgi:hypothetical protein